MYRLFALFCIFHSFVAAYEMPMLYNKLYETSYSSPEEAIVNHVKSSLGNALNLESKLNLTNFSSDRELNIWKSDTPSDHLLNNLCNRLRKVTEALKEI